MKLGGKVNLIENGVKFVWTPSTLSTPLVFSSPRLGIIFERLGASVRKRLDPLSSLETLTSMEGQ